MTQSREKIDAAIEAIEDGVPTHAQVDLAIKALEAYKSTNILNARQCEESNKALDKTLQWEAKSTKKGIINDTE